MSPRAQKAAPGSRAAAAKAPSPKARKTTKTTTKDSSTKSRKARDPLVAAALRGREAAHAPYSHFQVGAALRTRDGKVFLGCNVENSSYGLSICAERVAVTKAISEGEHDFEAIAVVTGSSPPSPPCGACRQFLAEFAPALRVILANPEGEQVELSLRELLPHAFDKTYL